MWHIAGLEAEATCLKVTASSLVRTIYYPDDLGCHVSVVVLVFVVSI